MTKTQVKSAIKKHGTWKGYIAPCNVSPFHIRGGWCLGMPVTFGNLSEMDETINGFTYYNCNHELGYYVAYWQD